MKKDAKQTILIASDHAGFELKNFLRDLLTSQGHTVEDLGPSTLDPKDDYPALIMPVGIRIAEDPEKYIGIVLGMSGQGEAMVCNRFPEVRAAVYYGGGMDIIKLAKEHNNANVLSLGAKFLTKEEAQKAVELWLATPFSGEERHAKRIAMIDSIE